MQLRGCGTALVTPFHQDGSLDEPALRNLISWQIESGIDFLVPCGTTGETPTLSHDEWLRVIDLTIETAGGRVPIMARGTANNTRDAGGKKKEAAPGAALPHQADAGRHLPAFQSRRRSLDEAAHPVQHRRTHGHEHRNGNTVTP